jgi:hypothetical protein
MTNISILDPIRVIPDWASIGARFCLLTAGLLAPWIAIAALPLFRFGIWIDVEPTLIVYHWIAALFAGGLFLDRVTTSQISLSPIVSGIGILIALSLCTLPFALNAGLTWYGLPDSGQGILSLIGFTFMLLGFKRLIDEGYSHFLWVNTALAILTISGFTLIGNIWGKGTPLAEWSPYVFSAFMAFMAIGLLALSLTSESKKYRIVGTIFSGVLILLSSNKTAIISLAVILGVLESKTISTYLQKYVRIRLSLIVGLAPLAILGSMILFSGPTSFPSLWSRVRIIQMVGLEMLEHPWRLLVGYGWGSYTDTFLANLTRVPEAMYQNGIWNPTWDALAHINSHSHHQVAEALLSTGVLGALIVLLLPALAVYISDRDKLIPAFIVFFLYTSVSSGWFEIPATLPFIALSYAVFWPKEVSWNKTISSLFLIPCYVIGGVLCFKGGTQTFNVGIAYPGPRSLISESYGEALPIPCNRAIEAAGPGGVHLAHHLRSLINESAHYRYTNRQIIEEISELVCAAQSIKQPTFSLMLSLITLTGDIAKIDTFRWAKPLRDQLLPQWRPMLEAILIKAPYRTDLLAPYFRWQIKQGNRTEVWNWCDQILIKNPTDPIALWFKGLLLKDIEQETAAHKLLKDALNAGVTRLLPVDPHFKNQIENYVE